MHRNLSILSCFIGCKPIFWQQNHSWMVMIRVYCRREIAHSISVLGKLIICPVIGNWGWSTGCRRENDPGEQHDFDRGPRALTHAASVTAPSLSQAFPLVGCVVVHLLPVSKQCRAWLICYWDNFDVHNIILYTSGMFFKNETILSDIS